MDETVFREKKHEIIIYWVLTVVFIVASGVLSGWRFGHPASMLLIMATVCALGASFQTWAYFRHPNKVVVNRSGIHVYYRSFTLSSNTSFWVDSCRTYHWGYIKNVYVDWEESFSRGKLYETFIVIENEPGNVSTIWITGISYNRSRLAESIIHFSDAKSSFDFEKTAANSKKRLGLCLWYTLLPVIIGMVLGLIAIKCTRG